MGAIQRRLRGDPEPTAALLFRFVALVTFIMLMPVFVRHYVPITYPELADSVNHLTADRSCKMGLAAKATAQSVFSQIGVAPKPGFGELAGRTPCVIKKILPCWWGGRVCKMHHGRRCCRRRRRPCLCGGGWHLGSSVGVNTGGPGTSVLAEALASAASFSFSSDDAPGSGSSRTRVRDCETLAHCPDR